MKITLVFFTVLGIYMACSQVPVAALDIVTVQEDTVPVKKQYADTVPVKPVAVMRLFPNPAKNKVDVEIRNFDPGYVQLQLVDINGKLIRNEKRMVFSGNENIVFMFSETPGLYFLWLKQGEIRLKTKLMVQ